MQVAVNEPVLIWVRVKVVELVKTTVGVGVGVSVWVGVGVDEAVNPGTRSPGA